jgi:hypothetical protein
VLDVEYGVAVFATGIDFLFVESYMYPAVMLVEEYRDGEFVTRYNADSMDALGVAVVTLSVPATPQPVKRIRVTMSIGDDTTLDTLRLIGTTELVVPTPPAVPPSPTPQATKPTTTARATTMHSSTTTSATMFAGVTNAVTPQTTSYTAIKAMMSSPSSTSVNVVLLMSSPCLCRCDWCIHCDRRCGSSDCVGGDRSRRFLRFASCKLRDSLSIDDLLNAIFRANRAATRAV